MTEEKSNIEILKELTPKLGAFIIGRPQGDMIKYRPRDGEGDFIGFGLHKEPGVAVQRVFISRGTKVEAHNHKESEYIVVYSGCIRIKREPNGSAIVGEKHAHDETVVLRSGDGVYFKPNERHCGVILEDAWIISITIPASEDYPNGR